MQIGSGIIMAPPRFGLEQGVNSERKLVSRIALEINARVAEQREKESDNVFGGTQDPWKCGAQILKASTTKCLGSWGTV
jgi:hypothetical protein